MKSRFVLLMMIVLSVLLQFACLGKVGESPTGPSDPTDPPFVEKRYTVKVEYIRVDVKRPDLMWKVVGVTMHDNNLGKSVFSDLITKKDDYHYEETYSDILETESYNSCYYIYGVDPSRWDGADNSSAVVGDRFIVTVIETGSRVSN